MKINQNKKSARRFSFSFWLLILTFLCVLDASAASYRTHVVRQPSEPASWQTARVWINSDTATGETAGVEYHVGTSYLKVLGVYDTSYPGANWRVDIPAQTAGNFVEYQLFTRNQSGGDYGFTGFSWNYTVADNVHWNEMRHDTFNPAYRSPFGAVTTGSTVTLRFRTDVFDVQNVFLRTYIYNPATHTTSGAIDTAMTYDTTAAENGVDYSYYKIDYVVPNQAAIIYYKFRIVDASATAFYGDAFNGQHDNLGQGGDGVPSAGEGFESFQITVHSPSFQTPTWLHNSAVYQIFPDRFRNGDITNDWCRAGSTTGCPNLYGAPTSEVIAQTVWNKKMVDPRAAGNNNAYGSQFYGGDLKGVQDKLDYIKNLGFDTIYFTPIFAGRSNHGYDTDDYFKIAPQLGGDAAFQNLVTAANSKGMKIIADGVFNHSSQDGIYFDHFGRYAQDGACENLNSVYRNWFEFNNQPQTFPCDYTQYNGWFGFGGLPVHNTGNPALRDFFYRANNNVTKYWLNNGVAGWRFDVADNFGVDSGHDWWRDYRPYAKAANPNAPLIGEIWYDASQYLTGDQLDSVMNYRFRRNILGFARNANFSDNDNNGDREIIGLNPSQFNRAMMAIREDYPLQVQLAMLNLLDSHDTNRALYTLTLLGDNGVIEAKQRLKLAAAFQFAYLGAPMTYYGDEAALDSPALANGVNGAEDDPYNRAPYPWADESKDATANYGDADADMLAYYTKLGSLRRNHPALRTGSYDVLHMGDITAAANDNNIYAFGRRAGSNKVIVVMNNGAASNTATIPVGAYFANGIQLNDELNNSLNALHTVSGGNITITIPARSAAILVDASNPTAANASIDGQIIAASGKGLPNVVVTLQNMTTGETQRTTTGKGGLYRFVDLPLNDFYTIAPRSKKYSFAPASQVISLTGNLDSLNFSAQ